MAFTPALTISLLDGPPAQVVADLHTMASPELLNRGEGRSLVILERLSQQPYAQVLWVERRSIMPLILRDIETELLGRPIVSYYGPRRHALDTSTRPGKVVVTTYETLCVDTWLQAQCWDIVVLSHISTSLKNLHSRRSQVISGLSASRMLV